MKILAYVPPRNEYHSSDSPKHSGLDRNAPGFYTWTDSCRLQSDRPLFIPDFYEKYVAVPAIAVKAGRLGKAIPLRFTPRYFDEWATALIILPADVVADFHNGNPLPAQALCFDNSVVTGKCHSVGNIPEPLPSSDGTASLSSGLLPGQLIITIENTGLNTGSASDDASVLRKEVIIPSGMFPEAFRYISEFSMIKTGDLIIIPSEDIFYIKPGLTISITSTLSGLSDPELLTRFK